MPIRLVKTVRKNKRRGRGYGSGKGGHTVGYGQKGQRSRGKGKPGVIHEGGRVPIHRKLPKVRGAELKPKTTYTVITLKQLVEKIKAYKGKQPIKVISEKTLRLLGYKPSNGPFKIIGRLEKKVKLGIAGVKHTKGVKDSLA